MMSKLIDTKELAASVVAVPPLALHEDGTVNVAANLAVGTHIRKGGVRYILYGGNANLYHYTLERYAEAMETIETVAAQLDVEVITSIGPDFGKAMDQIALIEKTALKNVMVLPTAMPFDSHGVGVGVRRLADRLGRGLILYIRRENYIHPVTLERLLKDEAIRFVKYAVERADPADDPYLDSLLAVAGPDLITSGMGEEPTLNHVGERKLATFTSGAVCIAPAASQRLLRALKAERYAEARELIAPFIAFERVRARRGTLQALHEAVSQHILDMGPLTPMVSNVKAQFRNEVTEVLPALVEAERAAVALAS